MTGSDDNTSTRPISVAELLAKNGTIGAPPVGGRRRRRRGNADAVTVAELTGEIPIIRPDDPPPSEPVPAAETPEVVAPVEEPVAEPVDEAVEADGAPPAADIEAEAVEADEPEAEAEAAVEAEAEKSEAEAGAEAEAEAADETDDDYADAVAAYAARLQQRDTEDETDTEDEDEPVQAEPTRRFGFGRLGRKNPEVDAETWTPDPVDGSSDATEVTDELDEPVEVEELDAEAAVEEERDGSLKDPVDDPMDGSLDDDADRDELPSYLRSSEEPLFGGQSVADDALRGGRTTRDGADDAKAADDSDFDDEFDEQDEPRTMSSAVHGLWIVGQSVVAVVFGAGLFVAFDQLWKWNNIVALVLSVLVILGLVIGVRVVRKTEDIGSTLIAVAVGALVTLGPLALLQSG